MFEPENGYLARTNEVERLPSVEVYKFRTLCQG